MKEIHLSLEFPGIVVFDPANLCQFIDDHRIKQKDLFHVFVERPEIGDAAVAQGVIFPIYTIEPDDYTLRISTQQTQPQPDSQFCYTHIPFRCTSKVVVFSDIYAIMNWDGPYYRNDLHNHHNRLNNHDMALIDPGNYALTIAGAYDAKLEKKFYAIEFCKTQSLPELPADRAAMDYDFNIKA